MAKATPAKSRAAKSRTHKGRPDNTAAQATGTGKPDEMTGSTKAGENSKTSKTASKTANPTKEKNKGGRPAKYTNPEQLQEAINAYFAKCDEGEMIETITKNGKGELVNYRRKIPPTMAGLALSLGFASTQSMANATNKSENGKDSWLSVLISHARTRIESGYAVNAMQGLYDPKFTQFLLAAQFGYITKQQIDLGKKLEDVLADLDGEGKSGGKSAA